MCPLYSQVAEAKGAEGASAPSQSFFFWGGGGHNPHVCRIINNFINFTTFNSLGLKNTILESSSTRLVCFGQQTTYVVSWFGTFHFFICTPSLPPYGRLSYLVFDVGTIEDCIRGEKMLSASLKKKFQRPPFIAYGGGGWGEEMEWLILI